MSVAAAWENKPTLIGKRHVLEASSPGGLFTKTAITFFSNDLPFMLVTK